MSPLFVSCRLFISFLNPVIVIVKSWAFSILLGLVLGASAIAHGSESIHALEKKFENPPDSARPRVWWHWINNNVSREGITKDLEWMRRVGVRGFQLYDVNMHVDQYVLRPAKFMSKQWLDNLDYAASEAKRLDLEMALHITGGWSQSGGPWVKPDQAMKKYVWSEIQVNGSSTGPVVLPQPPATPGSYADISKEVGYVLPRTEGSIRNPTGSNEEPALEVPDFYQDQHVFAYPTPKARSSLTDVPFRLLVNGELRASEITNDGLFGEILSVPYIDSGSIITYQFSRDVTLGSVLIALGHELPVGVVQYSLNGKNWTVLTEIARDDFGWSKAQVRTLDFAEVTARFFRIVFLSPITSVSAEPTDYLVREVQWSIGQVNGVESKAGFDLAVDYDSISTPAGANAHAVAADSVIELTHLMRPEGVLDWDVPSGDWTVVRLGYSLTGALNQHAGDGALGLEVDKLNAEHVQEYLKGYLEPIRRRSPTTFGEGGVESLLIESWEAGLSNWTQNMFTEFKRLRGYDPIPYAPILTGQIVDQAEVSDSFLWDWRRTISDLLVENYSAGIQGYAERTGLSVYAESMGTNLPTLGDGMRMKAVADIPMAEFWYVSPGDPNGQLKYRYLTDVREAASVANLYGQGIVAAESFTTLPPYHAPWGQGPRDLKWVADYYFTEGVNRIVIHSSDHQPDDNISPGFTLWQFGQFFSRHETWAEQSKSWIDYLSRVSFLLQQGNHVADVALFIGEGAPLTAPFWDAGITVVPPGYDYDYIDVETILNRLDVENGWLVTPSGARFRVLVVPDQIKRMTSELVSKLDELVRKGATVISPRPIGSPSLADKLYAGSRYNELVDRLWGREVVTKPYQYSRGKGRLFVNTELANVLAELGIGRDVDLGNSSGLKWIHRKIDDGDIYFIANLTAEKLRRKIHFRAKQREVTAWYPETGQRREVQATVSKDSSSKEGTFVEMELEAGESVFIVFSDERPSETGPASVIQQASLEVPGPWKLSFLDKKQDAPDLSISKLSGWEVHSNNAVRHYSGTAAYSTTFQAPEELEAEAEVEGEGEYILSLGDVGQIAQVFLNDIEIGTDWMPPYEVRAKGALIPGLNRLEIRVTNLWANRLIGDAALPQDKTYTQTLFRPYTKESWYSIISGSTTDHSLFPSGLMGPVNLLYRGVRTESHASMQR